MRYVFDDFTLEKYDITLQECIILILKDLNINLQEIITSLEQKGLVIDNHLSLKSVQLLMDIKFNSIIDDTINDPKRFLKLAEELRKEFPEGKKDGTNYYWRGSNVEIAKKLETLVKKHKFKFTNEQAINATKKYVASFNGNYRYMQLLKYFILKNVNTENGTEIKSAFMEYIENENDEVTDNINSSEWNNEIVN